MKFDYLIGKGFNRWSEGKYTPGQLKAMSDYRSSSILLSGAYRGGKTEAISRIGIRHAYFFPGSKVGIFRAHLASLKKSTLVTVLELLHPSWMEEWSNTSLAARLINGSELWFIGADFSDRLGSIELTCALIDEAAEVSTESRGMIQGRLSGPLRLPSNLEELPPSTQEYLINTQDNRQTFLACNPKNDNHPLYLDFFGEKAKPGHTVYNSNTVANPNLPPSYLKNNLCSYLRSGYTEEWVEEQLRLIRLGLLDENGLSLQEGLTPFGQRNLLGLWVSMEGAIYDMDKVKHVVKEAPKNWQPSGDFYAAVDFGFHNPRIIVAQHFINDKGEDCYLIVGYWDQKDCTPDDHVLALEKAVKKYNVRNAYLPPDQPGIIKTARVTIGASIIRKAKNPVKPGINVVTRFLSRDRLLFLEKEGAYEANHFSLCWSEMTGYRWATKKEQSTDEPLKENDHYPDAIRYLIYSRHSREIANVREILELEDDKTYRVGN